VPELEPRLLRLLGLVALALFFEAYDVSMLTSALKHIAEGLGMAESQLGGHLAVVRLGALPALLVIPLADRIGRRRVFLGTIVGVSLGTFATAFVQTPAQFVAVQMLTRTFVLAGAAVAAVIVTEEFPAEHRGWGVGMLGALSACGFGAGAALFAAIDLLPWGWRALYAIGVLPLFLLPVLRRELRETARFRAHAEERRGRGDDPSALGGWHRPLAGLARAHPGRAAVITLAAWLFAFAEVSVFQFTSYFTQTVHAWAPGDYSAMVLVGGGFGIVGNVVAGRLGDRLGRRLVGALFVGLFPACAWLFYRGPGWGVPFAFALVVFCQTAGGVVIRTLSAELFPTSHRGTSAGWVALVQTLGWAAGLAVAGLGVRAPGDIARMTTLLSLAALLAAVALLLLPETRRRELEAISDDDTEVLLAPP
jgi:putative MFS transporter